MNYTPRQSERNIGIDNWDLLKISSKESFIILLQKLHFQCRKDWFFLTLVWVREVMSKVDGGDIFSLVTFVAHSKFFFHTIQSCAILRLHSISCNLVNFFFCLSDLSVVSPILSRFLFFFSIQWFQLGIYWAIYGTNRSFNVVVFSKWIELMRCWKLQFLHHLTKRLLDLSSEVFFPALIYLKYKIYHSIDLRASKVMIYFHFFAFIFYKNRHIDICRGVWKYSGCRGSLAMLSSWIIKISFPALFHVLARAIKRPFKVAPSTPVPSCYVLAI